MFAVVVSTNRLIHTMLLLPPFSSALALFFLHSRSLCVHAEQRRERFCLHHRFNTCISNGFLQLFAIEMCACACVCIYSSNAATEILSCCNNLAAACYSLLITFPLCLFRRCSSLFRLNTDLLDIG